MFNIKKSYKEGVSFGLVSGVLTTLGLLIGLGVSTDSKVAVIGGIITIAIADALSDSFGVHLSQESSGLNSQKHIWEATISTFLSKFFFALTFLIPLFLFNLKEAVIVSAFWGMFLILALSFLVAKNNESKKGEITKVISEHLVLFFMISVSSYLVGLLINTYFE